MHNSIHDLTLSTGEQVEVTIQEHNHKVISLQPRITLNSNVIPHHAFQEIATYVSQLNLPYANKLYFHNTRLEFKIISFNLFGHITSALKTVLKSPIPISKVSDPKYNYSFIQPDYLPEIPDYVTDDINNITKKPHLLFKGHQHSTLQGHRYCLAQTYDVKYNTDYLLHQKQILPIITTRIYTTIRFFNVSHDIDRQILKVILMKKFEKHGVILIFKDI